MNLKQKYSITDGAFAKLEREVCTLKSLYDDVKTCKARIVAVVKAESAKASERDPRIVEALSVIFTTVYGSDQVFGTSKSGMGLDVKNGSPAATFWRVVVALLPKVKAARAPKGTSSRGVSEKALVGVASRMRTKYGKAACRVLAALLMA